MEDNPVTLAWIIELNRLVVNDKMNPEITDDKNPVASGVLRFRHASTQDFG
jgi:hypothetical protein